LNEYSLLQPQKPNFICMVTPLEAILIRHQANFHAVLPGAELPGALAPVNLSVQNSDMPIGLADDLPAFIQYIDQLRQARRALYLIGGYAELRGIYSRSDLFSAGAEPRRLHLGTDIWAPAGAPVFAFADGTVHSLANNEGLGDYGATLILQHQLDELVFYTLYGHISLSDINALNKGQLLPAGTEIAHFGQPTENGQWPPHLHFQIITDLEGNMGDYPGVCRASEQALWLANCPDPDLILQLNKWLLNG
jgi:peptidoglycan LD-endopeptidase LytH